MKNLDVCFVLLSTFLTITQAQQDVLGTKYLVFSPLTKREENILVFAQLVLLSLYIF